MRRRLGTVLILVAAVASCGGPPPEPVASVVVALDRGAAPLGGVVGMSYQFSVFEGQEPMTEDYRVFVHFADADGAVLWTDDHDPPVPTSRWQPGQTISYDRTMFLPLYPYVGASTIRVGLYPTDGSDRVPLAGDDDGSRSYAVSTLELLRQSENVFLIYQDGWHAPEGVPDTPDSEWRWTQDNATLAFRNPRRDVLLYLRADGRPDLVGGPQGVVLQIADREVARFSIENTDAELRLLPITQAQLGEEDMIELQILVDGSFIPAERSATNADDTRELGIRVFEIFVEAHVAGDDDGSRSYAVSTLELLRQSENVFLIYQDGWHAPEGVPDTPDSEWRWTQDNATLAFRNPRRDVLLYLRADGRPDLVGGPQGVVLQIADREVARFSIENTDAELRLLPITQAQLGEEDMIELQILVDGSFIPAERSATNADDTRELGIRVFEIFLIQ